jgi:hypothetical protein
MLLTSCQWFQTPISPPPDPDFTRVDYDALPMEVKEWVNNSRTMHIAHTKIFEGRRYILASYGEKPTGGYGIHIEDVEIGSDAIVVTIGHSDPAEGQNVTEALTYPRDIVYTENLSLPIEYVATGDREYVPLLVGIEELPTIMAESEFIKVFAPAPGSNVPETFTVEGVANVFEGTVNYLLRDTDGETTLEQYTTAGMGDWYFFEMDIELPDDFGDTFTLEMFTYSANDGSVTNLVEIPLQREQAGD